MGILSTPNNADLTKVKGLRNILVVANSLARAGAEKQIINIVKNLSDSFNFYFAFIIEKGECSEEIDNYLKGSIALEITKSIFYLDSTRKLVRLNNFVRQNNISLIHSWVYKPNLIGAIIKLLNKDTRFICSKRSHNSWYRKKHFFANKHLIYKISDRIVTNSNPLRDEILSYNSRQKDKVEVIYNGVDIINPDKILPDSSLLEIKKKKVIIGSVGRFNKLKRYEDILETARILGRKDIIGNFHFVIVGGRGIFDIIRREITDSGLGQYFTLTGEVSNPLSYMKVFDIFLISSSHEGMPNALMEAMTMGKPVVATNVGGIPDLIEDGVNGILIPPFRPDKIAEGLKELIRNKELQQEFASNNLVKIQEFATEKMISKVKAMYMDVLAK